MWSGTPSSSRSSCARVQSRARLGDDERSELRVERHVAAEQTTTQARSRLALQVLHRHEELAAFASELVHRDDVRVMDARDDARFIEEHRDERRLPREVRQDAFDDDRPLEAMRPLHTAKEDLRHSTTREVPRDLVATE